MRLQLRKSFSWPLPRSVRITPDIGAVVVRSQILEHRKGLPNGIVRRTGRAIRLDRAPTAGEVVIIRYTTITIDPKATIAIG